MACPNMILIGGTGRNSGKTTLACRLIQKFKDQYKVIAIKISPHIHQVPERLSILEHSEHYILSQETNFVSEKDTSKFLISGATRVFFLQVNDNFLHEAWANLQPHLSKNALIICEGGWLRKLVKPGVFIICNIRNSGGEGNSKASSLFKPEVVYSDINDLVESKLIISSDLAVSYDHKMEH